MPLETLLWDTIAPLALVVWMVLTFIGMLTHEPSDPPEQKSGERGIRFVARSGVDFGRVLVSWPVIGLTWSLSRARDTCTWLVQPKNGDHA